MQCPKCNGDMYDNRADKPSPKHPDYKCKDKDCGHAVWLKSKEEKPKGAPTAPRARWTAMGLMEVYAACLKVAIKTVRAQLGDEVANADILAATATLFIAASKDGPPPPRTDDA